jgi:hypothetical protein
MNKTIFSLNTLAKWSDLSQIMGVIGIIASLIFVGLELRQTQKIAIAGQQQARTILRINQLLSTYDFHPEEIGAENIAWKDQSDLQRYIAEQRRVYYWTVQENNYYQYSQGMMDQVLWDKEKVYVGMLWNACHMRYVFEAQVFIKPFENYVRSLPDLCSDEDKLDGFNDRF